MWNAGKQVQPERMARASPTVAASLRVPLAAGEKKDAKPAVAAARGRPCGWGAGGGTVAAGRRPGQECQSEDRMEVEAFLRGLGLGEYAEALLSNGFDDMDTLSHIEDADMKEIGMTPCHVVKLRRRLQELQRQRAEPGPELDEGNPVICFLRDAGLLQYAEVLLQSGFDELETLLEIEDNDMKDLGIPRGHAVKLKRRLREHRTASASSGRPRPAPQPAQVHAPTSASLPSEKGRTAVERSWEQVQALGTYAVGELLYRHTFQIAPEVIELFPPEVRFKYRDWMADEEHDESNVFHSPALRKLFAKFVNAIGSTVAGLHDFSRLVPMLTQLGSRHLSYGLNEGHWPIMGKALILTLRDCLGGSLTSEVESAWAMVYGFMSNIMIEGLRSAKAGAAQEPPLIRKALHTDAAEDDCHSVDSVTTGIPDDGGKDIWHQQVSQLTDDGAGRPALEDIGGESSVPPEVAR